MSTDGAYEQSASLSIGRGLLVLFTKYPDPLHAYDAPPTPTPGNSRKVLYTDGQTTIPVQRWLDSSM